MKKRVQITPAAAPGAKKHKQQSIVAAMGAAANKSPQLASQLPVVVENPPDPLISESHAQEIANMLDQYRFCWGNKGKRLQELNKRSLAASASRQAVDNIDDVGSAYIHSFRRTAELAAARGETVPLHFLEGLVLVMRNNRLHKSSHVSRAAHAALLQALRLRPYSVACCYDTTAKAPGSQGQPYVCVTESSAWIPIADDKESFTRKYLLIPDTALAGHKYCADGKAGTQCHQKVRATCWSSVVDLLAHCVAAALKSDEEDVDGDLLMMHYLLELLEQDLGARMAVREQLAERATEQELSAKEQGKVEGRRKLVLEGSLAWRVFTNSFVGTQAIRDLVRDLVSLIVTDKDDGENSADGEQDEVAVAGACVFTQPELGSMAARLLRVMLCIFGAAEDAGAFHSTGNHRTSAVNHRMLLDGHLLEVFWSERGLCKGTAAAAGLLRALPPRDVLRLLGMLAAQKFCNTYGMDAESLGTFGKVVGDLAPLMQSTHSMLNNRGTDVESFFQVNLCPVLASLHREPMRAAKTYKSVDHLAVMIGAIAAAVQALSANNEEVPCGPDGRQGLKRELQAAVVAVAEHASKKGGSQVEHEDEARRQLSRVGACQLALAQMVADGL